MKKIGSQIITLIVALLVWHLLTWRLEFWNSLVGFLVALLVTFKFGEMFTYAPARFLEPVRIFWFLYFIPVFVWEMIKANIDVAYRVLHPKLPINPGLVKVRTGLTSELAKTFLANSLTLTPGTTTVAIKGQEIYIHWIDVKATEIEAATKLIVAKYEKIIARIFE
jgi:multicomponent Na+:H+ antiporter subunit E